MSGEDFEQLVGRFFDAWNRQDLDACLAAADPDIEYVNAPSAIEPGTRHGHEGFAIVLRRQWEGLGPTARVEIDRIHADGDRLLVIGRMSREMPGSASKLEIRGVFRMAFRDGLITRVEQLGAGSSFESALKAAGLPE